MDRWLRSITGPPVIIECGAGRAVPTVRYFGETMARRLGATLVRINLREPEIDLRPGDETMPRGVSLKAGALDALKAIDRELEHQGF